MTVAGMQSVPTIPASPASHPSPVLSEEHERQVLVARARFRKISGAMRVASFNGGTAILFGSVALLSAFWSVPAGLLGVVLVGGGVHELVLRGKLRILEPSALPRLAWNQLLPALAVTAYCGWNMWRAGHMPTTLPQELRSGDPEIDAMVASTTQLVTKAMVGVYALVAVLTCLSQGLLAWYYVARKKHLRAYVRETPEWITRMQGKGAWG